MVSHNRYRNGLARRLCGVNGNKLSISGYSQIPISVKGKQFNGKFVVTDNIKVDAILGLDFLNENRCTIDCGKRLITFLTKEFSLPLEDSPRDMTPDPLG